MHTSQLRLERPTAFQAKLCRRQSLKSERYCYKLTFTNTHTPIPTYKIFLLSLSLSLFPNLRELNRRYTYALYHSQNMLRLACCIRIIFMKLVSSVLFQTFNLLYAHIWWGTLWLNPIVCMVPQCLYCTIGIMFINQFQIELNIFFLNNKTGLDKIWFYGQRKPANEYIELQNHFQIENSYFKTNYAL